MVLRNYVMHQAGQLGNYGLLNNTPETVDGFTTGFASSAFGSISEGLSLTSSPESQATDPAELVLTPDSEPARFPLGPGYSPYLCQLQQESNITNPVFEGTFSAGTSSVSFRQEGVDMSTSINSPNWYSGGSQQPTWNPASNPEDNSMAAYNTQISDQFPRQMPSDIYGAPDFGLQNVMGLGSPETGNDHTITTAPSEQSFAHPVNEGPANINNNFSGLMRFDNNDLPSPPEPADNPEGADKAKPEEPYAKLIQKALMSSKDYRMPLQKIYQWFRENTDKANRDGKGWQNSIRHNLSMNHAFVKCERSSGPRGTGESKKSTEWELTPWAIRDGVQSTTRYRKGHSTRRSGSTGNSRSHGNNPMRASSRRSGASTSKNRSVDVRRSALTRATTQDYYQRQVNSVDGSANNHHLSYDYHHNGLNPQHAANSMDRMDPLIQEAVPQTSNNGFAAYTYNPPQNEGMGMIFQEENPQVLYPAAEVTGAYGVSPLPTNAHGHDQQNAPLPYYQEHLLNPQQSVEGSYPAWCLTPGEGPYA